MTADTSSEILQWSNLFKGLKAKTDNLEFKEKNFQKDEIKTFSHLWKLKEFITCRPTL